MLKSSKYLAEKSIATTSVVPKAKVATTDVSQAGSKTLAGTRPEAELLLRCARTCLDSKSAGRIRALLQEDIGWAYLIQTARRHGVMPLLYWSLNNTCPEAVPQAILAQLRDHFQTNARRNILLTKELLKLLNLFESHGIPAIPYKGPVLAASIYGDLTLRQFGDLDILVQERDVQRARDLLISQGYRPKVQMTDAQEAAYFQSKCACGFVCDDGKVYVDLHWGVTLLKHFSFPIDDERLWERLEPVSLAGMTVRSIPSEDSLQILCIHGSRHCWERLRWICDVAELVRTHQGLDWRRILERADKLGNKRMLFLGLFLAKDLLGAVLPEEAWRRMQADPMIQLLAARVTEWLFSETDRPLGFSERSAYYLKVRERLRDRIPHYLRIVNHYRHRARRAITNKKDRALLPLPGSLSFLYYILAFLYYLLRPIWRAGKYGLWRMKGVIASGVEVTVGEGGTRDEA